MKISKEVSVRKKAVTGQVNLRISESALVLFLFSWGPSTKLLPTVNLFYEKKNTMIITFDDDIYYLPGIFPNIRFTRLLTLFVTSLHSKILVKKGILK